MRSSETHVLQILALILTVVKEQNTEKRLIKDDLDGRIKTIASYADAELCNLALHVAPNSAVQLRIEQDLYFPRASVRKTVHELLVRLSVKQNWSAATELANWFMNKVLPTLNWAFAKSDPGASPLNTPSQTFDTNSTNVEPIKTRPRRKDSIKEDADALSRAIDHAFNQASKVAEP